MLEFLVSLIQIPNPEIANNVSINVYVLELVEKTDKEQFKVVTLGLTKCKVCRHVNIMIVHDKYFVKPNNYQELPADNDEDDQTIKSTM